MQNEITIFDQILAGELPAKVIYEDDEVFAFNDINPQAPIHVLIIPKIKIKSFSQLNELSDDFAGRYFKAIAKLASQLGLDQSGYRVIFNMGKDGQQTVDYIHAHLLGNRAMSWPPG